MSLHAMGSVGDLIVHAIERHGERIAIEFGNECITYAQLGRDVARTVAFFEAKGVMPGDRISQISAMPGGPPQEIRSPHRKSLECRMHGLTPRAECWGVRILPRRWSLSRSEVGKKARLPETGRSRRQERKSVAPAVQSDLCLTFPQWKLRAKHSVARMRTTPRYRRKALRAEADAVRGLLNTALFAIPFGMVWLRSAKGVTKYAMADGRLASDRAVRWNDGDAARRPALRCWRRRRQRRKVSDQGQLR